MNIKNIVKGILKNVLVSNCYSFKTQKISTEFKSMNNKIQLADKTS